jgi:creatinine amidohydrolase
MGIIDMRYFTWKELDSLTRHNSIVFLCISPIEQHGPHLPLGTDYIFANNILEECLKKIEKSNSGYNLLRYPSIAAGFNSSISDFPGTVCFRVETLKNMVIDICESFYRHNFNKIVLINHHLDLGHIKAFYQANQHLRKKYNKCFLDVSSSLIYSEDVKTHSEDDFKDEIHADIRETSLMLYMKKQLVRDNYKYLARTKLDMASFYKSRGQYFSEFGIKDGYVGSPSEASAELGEKLFRTMIESSVSIIQNYVNTDYVPNISNNILQVMQYI